MAGSESLCFWSWGDGQRAANFNNICFKCLGTPLSLSLFLYSTVKNHSPSIQWPIPFEEGSHYLVMILFTTQMTKGTCGICEILEVQAAEAFQSFSLSFKNTQGQWGPWERHSKSALQCLWMLTQSADLAGPHFWQIWQSQNEQLPSGIWESRQGIKGVHDLSD